LFGTEPCANSVLDEHMPLERTRQFRLNLSDDELREMKQLAEWQRMSAADVVRGALRKLYLTKQSENQPEKKLTKPKKG
jgi:hypothetical protein